MLLVGHPLIAHPAFKGVGSETEAQSLAKGSLIAYIKGENKETLWKFCQENSVKYASKAASVKDAVLLNAMDAHYILCDRTQVLEFQKLADDYLFDSKILLLIGNEAEIEDAAKYRVDGVIFEGVIDGKL